MNKFTQVLFTSITVLITGCQAALPSQLSLPVSDVAYALENETQNGRDDIEPLDGKGNNLTNPDWGSANTNFLRLSPVDYTDGISSPAGADRPSARVISNTFSESPEDGVLNNRDFTAFVYAWGQFLDHDINLTETATPKEALPIVVPAGDAWFDPSSSGAMTIPMSRSKYDLTLAANQTRQQMNSITAFIDGSQVYGVDPQRATALREFSGGRMKTSDGNLLPLNTDGFPNANDAQLIEDTKLFLAGDVRANENPELLSLHTLFIREHNRIAARTAQRHPDWTDEQLYQHARRMVIAELQKITFEEFLPAILGTNAMPVYQGYDSNVNPGIATEFSTAAFRVGHSMLGDDIEFLDNDGEEIREEMGLRDSFFNPGVVSETDIDPILKYLASDNAQEIDTKVVDDVRNFLFGAPGQGGFDLASLNIQRGRDHGIADYNTVRVAYGLPRITSFEQITSDKTLQASLASTYGNVDNIDLWIGGLAEDHLPNSSMGTTFTAILVDQFSRLRDGDRFWYQIALSDRMLHDVQNTTLADVIRRNTELTKLQANVFFYNEEATVMIDSSVEPSNSQIEEGDEGQPPNDCRGQNCPPPPHRPHDGRPRPPRPPGQ